MYTVYNKNNEEVFTGELLDLINFIVSTADSIPKEMLNATFINNFNNTCSLVKYNNKYPVTFDTLLLNEDLSTGNPIMNESFNIKIPNIGCILKPLYSDDLLNKVIVAIRAYHLSNDGTLFENLVCIEYEYEDDACRMILKLLSNK